VGVDVDAGHSAPIGRILRFDHLALGRPLLGRILTSDLKLDQIQPVTILSSPTARRPSARMPDTHTQVVGWGVALASHIPLAGRLATARLLGPPPAAWAPPAIDVPEELLGSAGIPTSTDRPQPPLHDFRLVNPAQVAWSRSVQGRPAAGVRERLVRFAIDVRLEQLRRAARRLGRRRPRARTAAADPAALTAALRARARGAGLSALGVAAYDERWQFAERRAQVCGERMLVAVLEQDYKRMQQAPDREYQQTVRRTYVRLLDAANQLAVALQRAGYRARVYEDEGGAMTLPYAIAAGLGQLGMNGQVLTPQAGSRTRMLLISTDAPLTVDAPVDYGIPEICNRCGICAKRCPAGAISLREREHRGVTKWKIKTDRCLPLVSLADGCAVCIKTCPIQRHGLEHVLEAYRRTGEIVDRGGEAESYRWPLDGRVYRSGEHPRLPAEVRRPPALRDLAATEA
jgi:epoxyqueuosine reductase